MPCMHGTRTLFMVAVLLSVAGCPGKDKDDDKPAASAAATAIPLPTAAATATVKSDDPATPKIEPRVKAELDGRADGITGTPIAAAGATASLQNPTGWQTTKTDFTVSTSADKKAELAVGAFTPAEGP